MYRFSTFLLLLISNVANTKEIKSSINSLSSGVKTDIALPVAALGILFAGIMFILGKRDASDRLTQVLTGIVIVVFGGAIITFIQSKG